jgi:hypothetical protein
MGRIKPTDFVANRVYFTGFDRVTYSQVAWTPDEVENIKLDLQRKLKLLALIKGHVVIATSHLLESELAREIILPHPRLFTQHIVVPALRAEFTTCEGFLENKLETELPGEADLYRGAEQMEMARLIDSESLAVEWDVGETSDWFKSRLLADLMNSNSLLGLLLTQKGHKMPYEICESLENIPRLSRGIVYSAFKEHDNVEFREIVCTYTDFIYYLSGAKAVHSEGVLPQENIIDFQPIDLDQGQTPFSEHEIFFKVFVDLIKSATSTYFPIDLLDALTIEDAINLHDVATEEKFIDKYNTIQQMTKAGLEMTDPERLVFLMNELEEFERDLRRAYHAAIQAELPLRYREKMKGRAADFLHSIASLIITPYGILIGAKEILVSGLRLLDLNSLAQTIDSKIEKNINTLGAVASRVISEDRPTFLNFVDQIKSRYARRMFESGS